MGRQPQTVSASKDDIARRSDVASSAAPQSAPSLNGPDLAVIASVAPAGRVPYAEGESLDARIVAVAARDRVAFANLFAEAAPKVKAYLIRANLPANQAEEVAIEVLAQAWRQATGFAGAERTGWGWIFSLIRQVASLRGIQLKTPQQ
jgi:hypothetical protein